MFPRQQLCWRVQVIISENRGAQYVTLYVTLGQNSHFMICAINWWGLAKKRTLYTQGNRQ